MHTRVFALRRTLLIPGLFAACLVQAEDRNVSFSFDPPIAVGLPQTGGWTDTDKWGPTICLQYDDEGHCLTKGYPGQQPADATETVFYKVSLNGTAPFSTTTMEMSVMASVAEVKVASNTVLDVGGQLGFNWWHVPIVTPNPVWKRAILDNDGQVDVFGMIYSNGKMEIAGSGTVGLLGGTIRVNDLINTSRIEGAGTITRIGSVETLEFANSGLIDANFSGLPLILDALPAIKTLYNSGILRASDAGRLRIQGGNAVIPSGVIQNAGGTIQALDGSLVELYSLDIRNGSFATTGSGSIEVTGRNVAVTAVTNDGLLRINDGQQLTLAGSITNNGTLRIDAANANTELLITGTVLDDYGIDGNGTLELTHATRSVIRSTGAGFINGPEHQIRGTGLLQGIRRITNAGLIDADVAASALKVTSTGAGSIGNTGVMRARNGATLDINGANDANPVIFNNAGGILEAQDGSLVQLSYATLTGGTLTTSGSGVIRLPTSVTAIGSLQNLGRLDIRGSTRLLGGTLVNNGTMLLGSGSSGASLSINPGAVLGGSGTLTLSNSSSNEISSAAIGTGTLINDAGHTIRGAGKIGNYGLALTNRGLILADQSNSLTLGAGSYGATSVTNEGTLKAASGSTLMVNQNLSNFDSTTGTLTGGRYEVLGTLRLPVAGGIVHNGADIVLDGAGSRLYNGNAGTTDALAGFAINQSTGRFEVRGGQNFALGTFSNAGSMNVGAGSTLTAATYTQTAGVTDVSGSLLVVGAITLDGGTFTGSGAVTGNILNNGNVSPGNSPGTLSVNGDYLQSSGVLNIELGSLAHDQLVVSGTATLGGTLTVSLWAEAGAPQFVPSSGQQFDILQALVIGGAFSTINLPTTPGVLWELQHLVDASGSTDFLRLAAVAAPVPAPPAIGLLGTAIIFAAARARRRIL